MLELKQTQEYKKLKQLRGGKEQDKWKPENAGPERKSPSAERSQKQREDAMSTPQKVESPPRDFEDLEDELLRADKELQKEGGFLFKRGSDRKRVSFETVSPLKATDDELPSVGKQPRQ